MPFDIEKLVKYSQDSIERFAEAHRDETFYAFAIDASMLCLNSLERFEATLKKYQESWERRTRPIESLRDMTDQDWRDEKFLLEIHERGALDRSDEQACLAAINRKRESQRQRGCTYYRHEGILDLKMNTGDWAYQGFADLTEKHGFDLHLYSEHYDDASESEDGHAPNTEYAKAMTLLVDRLKRADAFKSLNQTSDFTATWVDHTY